MSGVSEPVFVVLTPAGLATALRAQAALGGEVHKLEKATVQAGRRLRGTPPHVERRGIRYVASASGSDALGRIDVEGREAAPIRLQEGEHDRKTGRGFGERHIEARHGTEIRAAGYPDAATMVREVAARFTAVYLGSGRKLLLASANGGARVAVVELSPAFDGSEWSVLTAGLYRLDLFKNEKALWTRPGPAESPVASVEAGEGPFDPGSQNAFYIAQGTGDDNAEGSFFPDTAAHLRALFAAGRPIVGICAAGILIRALAPLLADKRAEPAVLAVSEDGSAVAPLLGGHRGANALARRLAEALGGQAAITTAGDRRFGIALDEPPPGWSLANPQAAKAAMAALLAGASARIEGHAPWLAESGLPLATEEDHGGAVVRLVATTRAMTSAAMLSGGALVFHPRTLALGIGCERDAEPAHAIQLADQALASAGLAPAAVACVVSLDLKADEPAVHAVAAHLGVPARFFAAARLEAETPRLANPSETVFREVGCHGVAEGAALAAAGREARLVVPKLKSARVTCAVAEAPGPLDPASVGRARGRLAIVGIGPGSAEWLTPQARAELKRCDAAVGYSLYLDLVARLIAGAERVDSELGSEEARVRRALELAGEGRDVALISSGDAGIYAMATLAFECLEAGGVPDGAQRIEIAVAPGISAMQAAAARIGAPLGHDFCAISLSDLLTPWETIERRVRAAAEADFVIAFYNPVSLRRRTQLAAAKRILLEHRPPDTPVVLARNLGRDGESVRTVTLAELEVDAVDMLTIVIVGASSTRTVTAAGRSWVFTPRGYERKRNAAELG